MKFAVGVSWSRLIEAADRERHWLEDYVSCEQVLWQRRGSRKVRVEKRYSMLHEVTGIIPTGLISLVLRAASKAGHKVEILDNRPPAPCKVDPDADLEWLYDYQHAGVRIATRAGRGLLKVPTGGGKTEMFIGLTRTLPCEWLFVTHRKDLIKQAAERYRLRTGETAGIWTSRTGWQRGSCNVTVATFQGLHIAHKNSRLDEIAPYIGGLCIDEVHAQPATTFYKATMAFKQARYRIGLSGTPLDRGPIDSLRTIGAVGPIIYEVPVKLLIERGILAEPTIRMVKCYQKGVTKGVKWNEAYKSLIVNSPERNTVVCDMAQAAEKPAMIFVEEVRHGKLLKAELEARGLRAAFAYGKDPIEVRSTKINALVKNYHDVLICTVIFQEGIDVPSLRSVVVATGKASAVAVLQRIGRGMRTDTGKSTFEVWDVDDRGQKWLAEHADARYRTYRREGHEVETLDDLCQGNLPLPAQV